MAKKYSIGSKVAYTNYPISGPGSCFPNITFIEYGRVVKITKAYLYVRMDADREFHPPTLIRPTNKNLWPSSV